MPQTRFLGLDPNVELPDLKTIHPQDVMDIELEKDRLEGYEAYMGLRDLSVNIGSMLP